MFTERIKAILGRINWKKQLLYILTIFLVFLAICLVFVIGFTKKFLDSAGVSFAEVKHKIEVGLKKQSEFKKQRINFLILSLDKRNDKLENTLLTDTIIFASLNTTNGMLNLIPIPRDLWIDSLKTKINSLYYYGEEKGGNTGETNGPEYLLQEISTILGQPVNYWLIMDYPNLANLVDAIGGVDVKVEKSFIDGEFPNPEYVKATESGLPIYITVEFKEGVEHMNGDRALQFARSRKSEDLEAGTDNARSGRQMILFKALLAKMRSKAILTDPTRLATLYKFWKEKVNKNIKDEDLLGIIIGNKDGLKNGLLISSLEIPNTFKPIGEILVHPAIDKYDQWVYEPRDPTWQELKDFVRESLE